MTQTKVTDCECCGERKECVYDKFTIGDPSRTYEGWVCEDCSDKNQKEE